ncbi:MAG: ATP-binding protein [Saprospiraceae bacterium]|nr:ATP-binding protein [Saprospiraceae bacterium]
MKSIVITGPESSGKSTLAKALSAHYGIPLIEEYARRYIQTISRPYEEGDLVHIGQQQWLLQQKALRTNPMIVCDTGLVVLYIWSMEKYGRISSWLKQQLIDDTTSLYVLSKPDILWEPDPLRENPFDRDQLFLQYRTFLQQHHCPFIVVEGPEQKKRLAQTIHGIARISFN